MARLKVTTVLNAAELLALRPPEGRPRVTLRISLPGRFVTAEIAAKSLRKAQRAISEAGADNVALVLQGHLTADDTIAGAGLVRAAEGETAVTMTHREINHRPKVVMSRGLEGACWDSARRALSNRPRQSAFADRIQQRE